MTDKPLAQMSPEELQLAFRIKTLVLNDGQYLHALIQHATREATENSVPNEVYRWMKGERAEITKQRDEARTLADRLQGERDTLAWDLGASEAMVKSAYREGYEDAEDDPHNANAGRIEVAWLKSESLAALATAVRADTLAKVREVVEATNFTYGKSVANAGDRLVYYDSLMARLAALATGGE